MHPLLLFVDILYYSQPLRFNYPTSTSKFSTTLAHTPIFFATHVVDHWAPFCSTRPGQTTYRGRLPALSEWLLAATLNALTLCKS